MCIRDRIKANINGVEAILLIDTGSNVSLIDSVELERIKQNSNLPIPTLPINNIILVGATGRQNKSIKKQVSLEMTSNGVTIPVGLLVANNLPMSILIGCDILRPYNAVIDLEGKMITLKTNEGIWTNNLIDVQGDGTDNTPYQAIVNHYYCTNRPINMPLYQEENPELWLEKLEEIRDFQRTKARGLISETQAEQLIKLYNNYKRCV